MSQGGGEVLGPLGLLWVPGRGRVQAPTRFPHEVCTHLVSALGLDPPLMGAGGLVQPTTAQAGGWGPPLPGPGGQRAVSPRGLAGQSRAVQRLSPYSPGPRGETAWTTVSFPGWSPPSQSLSPLSRVRFRGLSLGWDQGEVRLACLPIVVFCGLSFKVTSEHRHLF